MLRLALTVALLPFAAFGSAQLLAFDSAANAAYNDGIQDNEQAGFGFNPWHAGTFETAELFVGSSNSNGNGEGPGIDTGGRSWGLRAREVTSFFSSHTALLSRLFQNNYWTRPGDRVSLTFDAGPLVSGMGSQWGGPYVQIGMLGGTGSPSVDLSQIQIGPGNRYSLSDMLGSENLIPITHGGVKVDWDVLTESSYRLTMTNLATGQSTSFFRTNLGMHTRFEGIFIKARHIGMDPVRSAYLNSISLSAVPEPATLTVVAFGTLWALTKRRRRRS